MPPALLGIGRRKSKVQLAARQAVEAFAPGFTQTKIIDSESAQWGITWTANPDLCFWRGKWRLIHDQNRAGGTNELNAGQNIGLAHSVDFATWVDDGEVFTDAAKSVIALPASNHIQPSLLAPLGDLGPLQCYWQRGNAIFIAELANDVAGTKWVIKRMMWRNGDAPELWAGPDLTGANPAVGLTDTATINGHANLASFVGSRPIVMTDGAIVIPLTLFSNTDDDPLVPGSVTSTFQRHWKASLALVSTDGGNTWYRTEIVPTTATFTPAGSWEQFVWESEDGDLFMGSRNLSVVVADADAQVVMLSKNRRSWSIPHSTEMPVSSQRHMVHRDRQSGRWWEVAVDHPYLANGQTSITGRYNGTLHVSRRGIDDFVPALPYSDLRLNVVYPQGYVKDGFAYVAFCRDENNRRNMYVSKVAVPTDTKAYVFPRRLSERSASGPIARVGPPAYLEFDGYQRATRSVPWTPAGSFSVAVQARMLSTTGIVIDNRSPNTAGMLLQGLSFSMRSMQLNHGIALTPNGHALFGVSINLGTRKARMFARNGGAAVQFVDAFLQAVQITGLPADGETLTVDGVVFTFRAAAAGALDVQIGASVGATATNLATVLTANGYRGSAFGVGEVVMHKPATLADFAVAPGGANVSLYGALPASMMSTAVAPKIGSGAVATSVQPGSFDLYEARGYDKALSDAEVKFIADEWSAALGLAVLGGGADPGAPTWDLKNGSSVVNWPDLNDLPIGKVTVAGQQVTVAGEGSCSVEVPWEGTALAIRYKLPVLPAGAKKFVIATFGTMSTAKRLYIAGDAPNTLKLDGVAVATIVDPTRWNDVEVVVTPDVVKVGDVVVARSQVAGRGPRVFLGSAFPESLLAATDLTLFDCAAMGVAEYLERPQAPAAVPTTQTLTAVELDAVGTTSTLANAAVVLGIRRIINGVRDAVDVFQLLGDRIKMGDGTNPVDLYIRRTAAAQVQTDAEVKVSKSTTNSAAFSTLDSVDTATRFVKTSRSEDTIGDGTNARDVKLYRASAGVYKTDNRMQAVDGFLGKTADTTGLTDVQIDALFSATVANGQVLVDTTNHQFQFRTNGVWRKVVNVVSGALSLASAAFLGANGASVITFRRSGDSFDRMRIRETGQLIGVDPTTGTEDATFGRVSSSQWGSNSELRSAPSSAGQACFTASVSSDAVSKWNLNSSALMTIGGGSVTRDTNLYRAGADRLQTDDHFLASLGVCTMNINSTALTSAQIDALWAAAPPSNTIVNDATNHIVLKRDAAAWYKSAAYTAV